MSNRTEEFFDTNGDGIKDRQIVKIFGETGNISWQYIYSDILQNGFHNEIQLLGYTESGIVHTNVTSYDNDQNGHLDQKQTVTYNRETGVISRDTLTLYENETGAVKSQTSNSYNQDGVLISAKVDLDVADGKYDQYFYKYHENGQMLSEVILYNEGSSANDKHDLQKEYDVSGNITKTFLNFDADYFFDKIISFEYVESVLVSSKEENDLDDDGDIDSVVNHFYDNDENIIKTTYDHDNDGVIDQVDEFTYRGRGEHKYKYQLFSHFDEDDDGVTDYIEEYKYLLDGTVKEENYDNDANGYAETGTSYYFGTYENETYLSKKYNFTFDNNTGEIVGRDSFRYLPDGRLGYIRYDEDVSDKEFITHYYYFHDDWGKLDKLNIKYTYDVEKPDYDPHFTRYEIFQYNEQELVGEYKRIFSNNEKYTETYFYDDNGNKTGTGIDYNWDGQFDRAIGFDLDTRGITTVIDYGLDLGGIKDYREKITYDENNNVILKEIFKDSDRDGEFDYAEAFSVDGNTEIFKVDANFDDFHEYQKSTTYFDDGSISAFYEAHYSTDNKLLSSNSSNYHSNGNLKSEFTMEDSDHDGKIDLNKSYNYHEDGSLKSYNITNTQYINGERITTSFSDRDGDGEFDKYSKSFFNSNYKYYLGYSDNDLSDELIDVSKYIFNDDNVIIGYNKYLNYNLNDYSYSDVYTVQYVFNNHGSVVKYVYNISKGNFTLLGNPGDNEFIMESGKSSIDGGDGRDTINYSYITTNLSVNLLTGLVDKDADSETDDTLTSIEDIITGSGDDIVTGDDNGNAINLGYGNDTVNAGAGDDDIITGDGNDIVTGGAGNDLINVGSTGSWGLKRLHGDDGHDVVYGGIAIDYLYGGNGNDYINGFTYFNFMEGNRDSDTIFGGADRDEIWGGNTETFGNAADFEFTDEGGILRHNFSYSSALETDVTDYIDAYHGNNIVYGGNNVRVTATTTGSFVNHIYGNIIFTGDHNDKIYGGSGADYIQTGNGVDLVYAGAGDDVINRDRTDSVGAKYIYGGDGNDEIHGGRGADRLSGGAGDDILYGHEYYNTLYGDDGNDTFYAGTHGDSIHGGTGDDIGFGYGVIWDADSSSYIEDSEIEGARDHFYGGEGNDTFYGGGGNDIIYGGTYDNVADEGDDWIYAGSGNDFVEAGGGHNRLFSGSGIDVIHGGSDIDEFNVGDLSQAGSKYFFGYGGDDVIWGGADNDSLHGGDGNDAIYGGDGGDYITGGNGDDDIWGGYGGDGIYGGNGADTFYFGEVETGTFVGDFNLSQGDKLDISRILSFDSEAGDDISQFLRIVDDSYYGQSDVEVRADGTGEWYRVADFAGTDLLSDTVDNLIASGNIILE